MQIESILEQIRDLLSGIFGIAKNDIGLSLLYRTNNDTDWDFLYTMNIENDISIQELLQNPNSSAKQIIDGHARSIFFACKATGAKLGQFVPGQLDQDRGMGGSIICRDVSISADHSAVRAVLTITTYGQPVCREEDVQAKRKLEEVILPSFELRLRNELALQYIKEVIASDAAEAV
jgi:hypothetical protein